MIVWLDSIERKEAMVLYFSLWCGLLLASHGLKISPLFYLAYAEFGRICMYSAWTCASKPRVLLNRHARLQRLLGEKCEQLAHYCYYVLSSHFQLVVILWMNDLQNVPSSPGLLALLKRLWLPSRIWSSSFPAAFHLSQHYCPFQRILFSHDTVYSK